MSAVKEKGGRSGGAGKEGRLVEFRGESVEDVIIEDRGIIVHVSQIPFASSSLCPISLGGSGHQWSHCFCVTCPLSSAWPGPCSSQTRPPEGAWGSSLSETRELIEQVPNCSSSRLITLLTV
ncbi:hypothetical protein PoB_004205500 [Plakobranchus ocellatus]|uniref:Uncharacterized protein n=1 Tax=Plakobranchus ocellatus TaxID=259542 RepID=A0AAV4B4N3_9GAST|nr:hypothetical protein PoB_004205500 [Plakobranchus ocellatus]